jgi:hypothetical protein
MRAGTGNKDLSNDGLMNSVHKVGSMETGFLVC